MSVGLSLELGVWAVRAETFVRLLSVHGVMVAECAEYTSILYHYMVLLPDGQFTVRGRYGL